MNLGVPFHAPGNYNYNISIKLALKAAYGTIDRIANVLDLERAVPAPDLLLCRSVIVLLHGQVD